MLSIHRPLVVVLSSVGITVASTAHTAPQLFEGSWIVKAFGNERTGGTGESSVYSAVGIPLGPQCNARQPRCPFDSTPTDGSGNLAPIFGYYCAPWSNWQGHGTTARPAKGGTAMNGPLGSRIPPLYRNPQFFSVGGQPNTTTCTATSTGATPGGKGWVQAGRPATGLWHATTTPTNGRISFAAAPPTPFSGIWVKGQAGELDGMYTYRYAYATLRNASGFFGPGSGPGSFNIAHKQGPNTVASINVKQGSAKFGGTMRMLGAVTSKSCYYRNGGCSIGTKNWRYDAIGTSARTSGGVVTAGYPALTKAYYYHSVLMQKSTVWVEGSRFPWTTGEVTVTAVGRGPHKTVHYARGYDNRTATSGAGTVQLVSPTLTRWLQVGVNFETGGIGIFRLRFERCCDPYDGDGVADDIDNCSERSNPGQDDTDADDCGNLCDADYDNNGTVGFPDFGAFAQNFGTTNELFKHVEPIPGGTVGFPDFGFFAANFGTTPGPSGTTAGTLACP